MRPPPFAFVLQNVSFSLSMLPCTRDTNALHIVAQQYSSSARHGCRPGLSINETRTTPLARTKPLLKKIRGLILCCSTICQVVVCNHSNVLKHIINASITTDPILHARQPSNECCSALLQPPHTSSRVYYYSCRLNAGGLGKEARTRTTCTTRFGRTKFKTPQVQLKGPKLPPGRPVSTRPISPLLKYSSLTTAAQQPAQSRDYSSTVA